MERTGSREDDQAGAGEVGEEKEAVVFNITTTVTYTQVVNICPLHLHHENSYWLNLLVPCFDVLLLSSAFFPPEPVPCAQGKRASLVCLKKGPVIEGEKSIQSQLR